jgi:hypothetical protein
MRGACRRINTVYRRARTIFRNAANRSRDLRGVSGHVTAHNCECNGLSDGIFRKTPPDFNILPGDATLATQGVVPGVTIICRCRYRCDGTRNQRLPHNDQTQITAVSLSLIKNQLVRTGAQQAQRLRRNADPRSVSNLVGSDTRVCMWRRVRPAANGGEYVGRSAAAHWAISGDLRSGRGGFCRSLFHHHHRCPSLPGSLAETPGANVQPCR